MILIVSSKGGVGKTAFSRGLCDILRAEGKEVAAWDADGAIGGFVKCLGLRDSQERLLPDQDRLLGVGYYDVRRDDERGGLINCISYGDDLIIQDIAGGALFDCSRVVDRGDSDMSGFLDILDARGYRLTLAHLLSNLMESAVSVGNWMDALPPDRCDHVAVLNQHFGRTVSDFPFWVGYSDTTGAQRGGANRRRMLESGGVEVTMPAIPPSTFAKLDALHMRPSIGGASPLLTVAEQAHSARFCRDLREQVKLADELLGWRD